MLAFTSNNLVHILRAEGHTCGLPCRNVGGDVDANGTVAL